MIYCILLELISILTCTRVWLTALVIVLNEGYTLKKKMSEQKKLGLHLTVSTLHIIYVFICLLTSLLVRSLISQFD